MSTKNQRYLNKIHITLKESQENNEPHASVNRFIICGCPVKRLRKHVRKEKIMYRKSDRDYKYSMLELRE